MAVKSASVLREVVGLPAILQITPKSAQPFNPFVAPHGHALSSPFGALHALTRRPLGAG